VRCVVRFTHSHSSNIDARRRNWRRVNTDTGIRHAMVAHRLTRTLIDSQREREQEQPAPSHFIPTQNIIHHSSTIIKLSNIKKAKHLLQFDSQFRSLSAINFDLFSHRATTKKNRKKKMSAATPDDGKRIMDQGWVLVQKKVRV
jgi:hypothetical protein